VIYESREAAGVARLASRTRLMRGRFAASIAG
jgi:hypothetical protein